MSSSLHVIPSVANPTTTDEDLNKLLRDLGLGQETTLAYPWNPQGSPIMCEEVEKRKNLDFGLDSTKSYWNSITKSPKYDCNEFIFTRQ